MIGAENTVPMVAISSVYSNVRKKLPDKTLPYCASDSLSVAMGVR